MSANTGAGVPLEERLRGHTTPVQRGKLAARQRLLAYGLRFNSLPSYWTFFHMGIIAFRFFTIVPLVRFEWLDFCDSPLFYINGWGSGHYDGR